MSTRPLKITGWIGLSAMVVLATIVLVAIGRGYSYDYRTGRLKINGLAIFASTPSGAEISINGKLLHRRTPFRTTLEAGDYSVDITKDGYRSWTKRISVIPSEVTWAQYILMLPDHLEQQSWLKASDLKLLTTSRDHRHFAYVDAAGAVWQFEASGHQPTKLYTPAAPAQALPVEKVTGLAWSGDASKLLIATSSDKVYQRLVSLSDGQVQKLTEQFGFDLSGLRFNPTNAKQLFWLAPEGLRRIDTDSQSLSAVLADHISAYSFGGSGQVVMIQASGLGKSLYSMDTSGQNKRELIQALANSDSYNIGFASYRNDDVVAILPAKSHTITLYTNLDTDQPASRVIAKSADDLSFNPDGRFLNFRNGSRLSTYDLEFNRTYNFATSKSAYDSLAWFDTYHLLTVAGGKVTLVEYDGANAATLAEGVITAQVSFTSNQHEVLWAQKQADGKVSLQATTIKR